MLEFWGERFRHLHHHCDFFLDGVLGSRRWRRFRPFPPPPLCVVVRRRSMGAQLALSAVSVLGQGVEFHLFPKGACVSMVSQLSRFSHASSGFRPHCQPVGPAAVLRAPPVRQPRSRPSVLQVLPGSRVLGFRPNPLFLHMGFAMRMNLNLNINPISWSWSQFASISQSLGKIDKNKII